MVPASASSTPAATWRLYRQERRWLALGLCLLFAFGVNLEQRTALRRRPMTDLGVFSCAAWAVWSGENLYTITDWHGWHYQYPPTLAILFAPLAHPLPQVPSVLPKGERRTELNTPWGCEIEGQRFFGLHKTNARFFAIVAVWYLVSLMLFAVATHALACTLEGNGLRVAPPDDLAQRKRWWAIRLLPLLICAGSVGTDLSRGQVDGLTLAAISLALYLISRNRDMGGGLLLAFPATIKLFPPFLLLYPFWRRRWRMTLGAATGLALFLVAIPAIVLGPQRTVELYKVWVNVLAKPSLGKGTDKSRAGELTGMNSTDNQSLLAAIHNWRFYKLPRRKRPPAAASTDRNAVYLTGLLLLAAVAIVSRARRKDSPHELLLVSGLLIGLALVINPIVHNYYYLLVMPIVTVLLDRGLARSPATARNWYLLTPLVVFMLTDIVVRLPGIGGWLRSLGLPLLSLLGLLAIGAAVLISQNKTTEKQIKDVFATDPAGR